MKKITVQVTNGNGQPVEVSPLVMAMIRVLVNGQEQITSHEQAAVELNYRAKPVKVSGKLRAHVGLERV